MAPLAQGLQSTTTLANPLDLAPRPPLCPLLLSLRLCSVRRIFLFPLPALTVLPNFQQTTGPGGFSIRRKIKSAAPERHFTPAPSIQQHGYSPAMYDVMR